MCVYTPKHQITHYKFKHSRNKSPKLTSLVFFLPYMFSPFPCTPAVCPTKHSPMGTLSGQKPSQGLGCRGGSARGAGEGLVLEPSCKVPSRPAHPASLLGPVEATA